MKPEGTALGVLARAAGLAEHWTDAQGRPQQVGPDTLRTVLAALALPAGTDAEARESLRALQERDAAPPALLVAEAGQACAVPGMTAGAARAYEIELDNGTLAQGVLQPDAQGAPCIVTPSRPGYNVLRIGERSLRLAVAPNRSAQRPIPPRAWGLAAQVYSLRCADPARAASRAGFGDFAALRELAEAAAARGAQALAISPVHALYSAHPEHDSPYSPSSRLFFNPLYADAAAVLGHAAVERAWQALPARERERAAALEARQQIDWPRAARLRLALLRQLHRDFARAPAALKRRYAGFRAAGGQALRDHAVFEALHAEHTEALGSPAVAHWQQWATPLRDARSEAVSAFAVRREADVDFHCFAQWLTTASLGETQQAARRAGMGVGLITDLAVGADPRGSQTWSRPGDFLAQLSIGAPPDIYNPLGQAWGLSAYSPTALQSQGYQPFIDLLRASLRHAGGVRIDHILGLARLWLVPGNQPAEGVYLRYPLEDLLRLVALETWRHEAVAIGEDLGTVPEGMGEALASAGVAGMSVLWFERGAASEGQAAPFLPPEQWPTSKVALTTTHDLPTVRGWWSGRDIDWRVRLNLLGADETEETLRAQRDADRDALWHALQPDPGRATPRAAPLARILGHVAATPAPLMLTALEDLCAATEQPNLPGTVEGHPNWRRRLPARLAQPFTQAAVQRRAALLQQARPGAPDDNAPPKETR
ncbi:4-alpha-glucanotransferase [Bordetella genomosp. 1]|uniref:4-alpha-glucanotransferase n=1 Tax=Bordetella genomosp. 1 TaxID=1395607 RepID=A0ABX4EXG6_9BORD|nr:4-alpha-glucanotransferase [Bordetella genomosp. 1]OZI63783.1 4-alpha-glucanotransferase [Bordetella genomosp. 1]